MPLINISHCPQYPPFPRSMTRKGSKQVLLPADCENDWLYRVDEHSVDADAYPPDPLDGWMFLSDLAKIPWLRRRFAAECAEEWDKTFMRTENSKDYANCQMWRAWSKARE